MIVCEFHLEVGNKREAGAEFILHGNAFTFTAEFLLVREAETLPEPIRFTPGPDRNHRERERERDEAIDRSPMAIISRSLRTLINLSHPPLSRSISSTPRLNSLGWFDKIKGAITGKPSPDPSKTTSFSLIGEFNLLFPLSFVSIFFGLLGLFRSSGVARVSFWGVDFANQMDKARKLGSFKNFVAGRCSEATISDAFEKHSEILRYLGSIDPTGEV